jgi:hypothetical protein
VTFIDALNHALREEMESDPKIVMWGGHRRSERGRVRCNARAGSRVSRTIMNSPLAGASIVGVACGDWRIPSDRRDPVRRSVLRAHPGMVRRVPEHRRRCQGTDEDRCPRPGSSMRRSSAWPLPASPNLELAVLPSVDSLRRGIEQVLRF